MVGKPRILVVDDDPLILESLIALLEDDYQVVTALSGVEAIKEASSDREIATVITDIKISGINGIQLAQRMRAIRSEVPIIFLTGYSGDYDEEEIDRAVHPFDFLRKGQSITRLLRSIRNAVRSHAAALAGGLVGSCTAICSVDGRARVVALREDGGYRFVDESLFSMGLLYVYSPDVIAFRAAVQEFEELVNDSTTTEQQLHTFFEQHPDFILDENYARAHSKIVLSREKDGPLIPDFVLEPFDSESLCDLLELKRPSAEVAVLKKNRYRYSAAVLEGIAQLVEYQRYFDEDRHRKAIENRYGLRAYRPRMFLILGRAPRIDPIALKKISAASSDAIVKTYDDLLRKMKRKLK
ncbi:DUF4263 domain-containing protein [bacterium]|nr:DUF4263 domain-containing protein [bacterium]